jgi:predicted RecB family nuclease
VYLRHKDEREEPPGPYEQVLLRLAERHEKAHLATLAAALDLSPGKWKERVEQTTEAIKPSVPLVYQGALEGVAVLGGVQYDVAGSPDFLIKVGDGYTIRDSKISLRINNEDHPEILRQLEFYGWLYQQTFGQAPKGLEVHSGRGIIVPVPYDGGEAVSSLLAVILQLKQVASEFYSPVGWSKCGGCGFFSRCWARAEAQKDVALVIGVDQGLARTLHERGICTFEDLLAKMDEQQLAELKRPYGHRLQRVGASAQRIMRNASVLARGEEQWLQSPILPDRPNYVMFDLEGLPPHLDELEKIYLWGLQVYGKIPSAYQGPTVEFGVEGDRRGWEAFLETAREILAQYGDLPFVHWHNYERVKLDMYVQRYGDINGVAARVRQNLYDLLPTTQQAVVLPLSSYSLKAVEAYTGFRRTRPEAKGDWAMAKYIEAIETEDSEQRAALIDEIRSYNCEDLAAMWAVFQWLRQKHV